MLDPSKAGRLKSQRTLASGNVLHLKSLYVIVDRTTSVIAEVGYVL